MKRKVFPSPVPDVVEELRLGENPDRRRDRSMLLAGDDRTDRQRPRRQRARDVGEIGPGSLIRSNGT